MILGLSMLARRYGYDGSTTFYKICSVTGKEYSVTMSKEQIVQLKSPDRPCIQNILTNFSMEQREFLMTGITPAEWDESFGDEE